MVVSPSTEAKAEVTQTTEVSSWWEDLENQKTNITEKYKPTPAQAVRLKDVFDTLSFAGVRTKAEIESIVKNVIKLTSATDWEVFTATLEKITAECVDVMLGNMKKPIVYTEAQISDRINNRTGVVASVDANDATKPAKQAEIITPASSPVVPEKTAEEKALDEQLRIENERKNAEVVKGDILTKEGQDKDKKIEIYKSLLQASYKDKTNLANIANYKIKKAKETKDNKARDTEFKAFQSSPSGQKTLEIIRKALTSEDQKTIPTDAEIFDLVRYQRRLIEKWDKCTKAEKESAIAFQSFVKSIDFNDWFDPESPTEGLNRRNFRSKSLDFNSMQEVSRSTQSTTEKPSLWNLTESFAAIKSNSMRTEPVFKDERTGKIRGWSEDEKLLEAFPFPAYLELYDWREPSSAMPFTKPT